ncbi:cytochrome P450 [Cytidiella melzeri]|nr:cytochrome P450 [Cytidiella melzeri]
MPGYVAQASAVVAVAWVFWKIVRKYIVPSALDTIPGPPRGSFLLGNMLELLGRGWEFQEALCAYGTIAKLNGILGEKLLFTYDPKALQHILLKDQQSFGQPSWFLAYNSAVFGPGLLTVVGEQHKRQRKLLNPAFSAPQMRRITPLLYRTAHALREAIQSNLPGAAKELDMLHWLSRSALESIGQGGLGYSFDPLTEKKPNKYADALKELGCGQKTKSPPKKSRPAFTNLAVFAPIVQHLGKLGSAEFRSRVVDNVPFRDVKMLKYVVDIMRNQSTQIYDEKKAGVTMKDGHSDDQEVDAGEAILAALLRENAEVSVEDRLPDVELISQMSTLVFAATDTTSGLMGRLLQVLAAHPDVQNKLRAEVNDARDGHDIPYDRLVQLPILDAVCKETLRMWPPTPLGFRQAQRDVLLPLGTSIRDTSGQKRDHIMVPKDTVVFIGIQATNRNKAVWGEDADQWKPERWLSPLPETVTNARIPGIYSHLMTFLGGSKSCIGFKFAEIEMKITLSVLIENFKFSLSDKDIYWNMSLVVFPTVGKTDEQSQLPLMVESLVR